MKYKQLVKFELKKMGTKKDWCLANVRAGFGIPAKYGDAKEAMLASKEAGHLHSIDTLPTDVSVPVFIDTPSIWEHVIVSDKGKFYSDGKELTSLDGLTVFGWSESLNDVRIVEPVEEPVEEPTPEAPVAPSETTTSTLQLGDTVVPTRLVDYDGTPLKQYDDTYTLYQLNGDRAVLMARGQIWAAMRVEDIKKA